MLGPYTLAAKVGLYAVALIGFISLCFSWSARGQEIAGLKNWQTGVTGTVSFVTNAKKPLDQSQVVVALQSMHDAYQRDEQTIAQLSAQTTEAKARAAVADAALANTNVALQAQFASSSKRIDALEAGVPEATEAAQCAVLVASSKAPWESWR